MPTLAASAAFTFSTTLTVFAVFSVASLLFVIVVAHLNFSCGTCRAESARFSPGAPNVFFFKE
jgi:hypothetical protein